MPKTAETKVVKSQFRIDAEEIGEPDKTKEGYLIVPGVAASTGILKYHEAKGKVRRELVTADTLRDSADSIVGKPVTLEHPKRGEVVPENFKDEVVGEVSEAWFDEDAGKLRVKLRIKDQEAIRRVRAGMRDLSPGYDADIEYSGGQHDDFGKFDVVQKSRTHNHLALTEEARDDESAITRLDSSGQAIMPKRQDSTHEDQGGESGGGEQPASKGGGGESGDTRGSDQMLRDLETKLDKITETMNRLLETLAPEDAEEAEGGEQSGGESGESGGDGPSKEKRMDWFRARRDALESAKQSGADVDEDSDTVLDLKRKAVEARRGVRLDSDVKVEAAYELEFGGDGTGDEETREDSGDWGFGDPHVPEGDDDDGDFENRHEEPESRKKFKQNITGD